MSFRPPQRFLDLTMSAALAISQAILRVPDAPRAIPRRIPVSGQTVSNWIEGRTTPSAVNLIQLMAEFDEVADEVLRLSQRGGGLTEVQKRKLLEAIGEK